MASQATYPPPNQTPPLHKKGFQSQPYRGKPMGGTLVGRVGWPAQALTTSLRLTSLWLTWISVFKSQESSQTGQSFWLKKFRGKF